MKELTIKNGSYDLNEIKESPIFKALKSSVFPGAKDESVLMVIDYCKAKNLDPLSKVVHLVPMYIEDKQTGIKGMRDVVMEGIDSHRVKASRTGKHIGTSEPEFGEIITKKLGSMTISFPFYAKIVVKKLLDDGTVAEFVGKEFWLENYATKGRDDETPNKMWAKRTFSQLAKCAEAQGLRRAFPELCAHPTAEEMEGKYIESIEDITNTNSKIGTLAAAFKKNEKKAIEHNVAIEPENPIETKDNSEIVDAFSNNIQGATTIDELEKIRVGITASTQLNETDKNQLRIVYTDKKKALKEAKGVEDFVKEMDSES